MRGGGLEACKIERLSCQGVKERNVKSEMEAGFVWGPEVKPGPSPAHIFGAGVHLVHLSFKIE